MLAAATPGVRFRGRNLLIALHCVAFSYFYYSLSSRAVRQAASPVALLDGRVRAAPVAQVFDRENA